MSGYPSEAEVFSYATDNNRDPIVIFAFRREHQRLPSNAQEAVNYESQILADLAHIGYGAYPFQFMAAYIEANGGPPASADQFFNWGKRNGLIDQSGNPVNYPTATQFAGDQAATPTSTGVVPAPPPGPLDGLMNTLGAHPVLSAAGALGVGYVLIRLLK